MRETRFNEFLLRDYQIPILVEPTFWLREEAGSDYPELKSHQVREIVYVGATWPSPSDVAEAIGQYRTKFGRQPDRIVMPPLLGGAFLGVPLVAGLGGSDV